MRTFEVGKRYSESGLVFEIVKRTAKSITYTYIHHPGRSNEKKGEEKRARIYETPRQDCETFFTGYCEVDA